MLYFIFQLLQNAAEISTFGNGEKNAGRPLLTMNGITTPIPPSKHIALHLLSTFLDDETIFSLEESNPSGEALLPLSVDRSISYNANTAVAIS